MSDDPERLLTSVDVDDDAELERELLRSIVDVSPPANAEDAAWDGITARIAAASALAAGAAALARAGTQVTAAPAAASALEAAPVATGLAHALVAKVMVGAVVAVTATAAAGGLWLEHRARPKSEANAGVAAPARNVAQPKTPVAAPVTDEMPAESAAPDTAPRAENDARSHGELRSIGRALRAHPEETLAAESALLTEARASLRSGDPAGALAALRRLDARAPHGVLRQEREVLAIQALAASGAHAAAARRAQAFIDAYPNSPHVPSLRPLAGSP